MMELGQDWTALQRTLFPKKKGRAPANSDAVLVAHQAEKCLRLVSDCDDLAAAAGSPISEIEPRVDSSKRLACFEAAAIDQALEASLSAGGVFHQLESIRAKLKTTKGVLPEARKNFLVEALTNSWWSKLLPSQFGIYLHFEGREATSAGTLPTSLLILFKRGRVDQFDDPDLSSLSQERSRDPNEVMKYLREKYSTPIQGVYVHEADWQEWCESTETPWKAIAKAMRVNRVNLVPFRMGAAALIGARAHVGV